MSAKKYKLKKIVGNDLFNFINRNFNIEQATQLIQKYFNNDGRDARYIQSSEFNTLKAFLNFVSGDKKEKEKEKKKITATELLKSVGYDLIRVKTQGDAKPFKKYFEKNELLCKFNSSSTFTGTDVYFIVKEDADKIKRSDSPKRQDEYSTSVMSTKISKDGRNVLQITSRYNHTVSCCDNTFNSNLDAIVDGLSEAFNYEFGYKIKRKSAMFEFANFVEIDNMFVYYHKEISGIKIGDNTLVTDKIVNFSSDRYYTYDYFIIDLKDKRIVWKEYFKDTKDGFVDYFNSGVVKKIEFVKDIDLVDDNDSDEICYIQK